MVIGNPKVSSINFQLVGIAFSFFGKGGGHWRTGYRVKVFFTPEHRKQDQWRHRKSEGSHKIPDVQMRDRSGYRHVYQAA